MATSQFYTPIHAARMHWLQMKHRARKPTIGGIDDIMSGIAMNGRNQFIRDRLQRVGDFTFHFSKGVMNPVDSDAQFIDI